jgi:two-component system cell cycle sensor histidine kinase PleC
MVEGRAQESQVSLTSEELPEDVQVMADRRALMQVLLNLLSNAVKFTNAGGAVGIACRSLSGGVEIVVSDTGIGIPKDKIGIVTEAFEQISSELTRKHEGSGLGLAITKDLIELHGGKLDIESEVGIGTTVRVFLPKKLPASKNVKTLPQESAYPVQHRSEMAG